MLHWNYHGFMSKLPEIKLFTHIYIWYNLHSRIIAQNSL